MNIKQFVEQSEREFMDKFVTTDGFGIPHPDSLAMQIKSFTSSKLRELIEEVRNTIDDKRLIGKDIIDIGSEFATPRDYKRQGFNNALDSVIQLLDEANHD